MTGSVRRAAAPLVGLLVAGVLSFASAIPAAAQAPSLIGEAYGHYTSVSLFGGPASPVGPAPTVTLPAAGSAQPLTGAEPNGGSATYGPAKIFGGIWNSDVAQAPPSGPITVSTKGTVDGGSVTSTADIGLYTKPVAVACSGNKTGCTAPGGFGPMPVTQGEQLHSTCTATPSGVTGSASFVKAQIAKSTDSSGEPTGVENVPDNPPVNYTQTGTITNVGDNWRIVFNEQIKGNDGSLTVNAIHMFLLGPTALGEQIVGHVKCFLQTSGAPSTTSPSASTTIQAPPTTATPSPTTAVPPASTPASTDKGSSALPYILIAAVGVVVAVGLLLFIVRRARAGPAPPPAA